MIATHKTATVAVARRLTRALGEVRDIDVQVACVQHVLEHQAGLEERPGLERLLLAVENTENTATAAMEGTPLTAH